MPPERRQRTTSLQEVEGAMRKAEYAINNATAMNEDARSQLFAASLLQLNQEHQELAAPRACLLMEYCIDAGWKSGIALAISALTVDDIAKHSFLDYIASRPNLDEETKVDILTLFLLRNCSVNEFRQNIVKYDDPKYCVYATQGHDVVWKSEFGISVSRRNDCFIHFVQTVISYGLPSVLELILPRLNKKGYQFAIIESIGSNSKKCWEILLDNENKKLHEFELECLAIYFAASYGRTALLRKMLKTASESTLDSLKNHGMYFDLSFVQITASRGKGASSSSSSSSERNWHVKNSESILECTCRMNQPECVKLLIEHDLMVSVESHGEILKNCSESNFTGCAKLLIDACEICSRTLMGILEAQLRIGLNQELILTVVKELRTISNNNKKDSDDEVAAFLKNILLYCFGKRWYGGLFILVSEGIGVLASSSDVFDLTIAEETLNALVIQDDSRCNEIIKHLLLTPEINLVPSFEHCVLRSENMELVEFFLSFNNTTIFKAAQELRSRVENETIKELLENAEYSKVNIKIEATDDEVHIEGKS